MGRGGRADRSDRRSRNSAGSPESGAAASRVGFSRARAFHETHRPGRDPLLPLGRSHDRLGARGTPAHGIGTRAAEASGPDSPRGQRPRRLAVRLARGGRPAVSPPRWTSRGPAGVLGVPPGSLEAARAREGDLVHDRAPQIHPEKLDRNGVLVDPAAEILANKLCTLVSRGGVRDLVDVLFLERAGLRVEDAIGPASTKDDGLSAAQLAWVLPRSPSVPTLASPQASRQPISRPSSRISSPA